MQHPVSVRVTPLDPVRRGEVLRLRVDVATEASLEDVQVRLAHPGGAGVVGSRDRVVGALAPGSRGSSEFLVRVPEKGHRALLQFQVTGEGPRGTIARGATYNLLPDGPADPGRLVPRAGGGDLREYAAGRMP